MGDPKEIMVLFLQRTVSVFQQKVYTHSQAGERGAQLMGCGHDKFAFELFNLLEPGYIP